MTVSRSVLESDKKSRDSRESNFFTYTADSNNLIPPITKSPRVMSGYQPAVSRLVLSGRSSVARQGGSKKVLSGVEYKGVKSGAHIFPVVASVLVVGAFVSSVFLYSQTAHKGSLASDPQPGRSRFVASVAIVLKPYGLKLLDLVNPKLEYLRSE